MAGTVNTVLGPVEADAIGKTLMHEHTTIFWPGAEITDAFGPAEAQLESVVDQLEKAKAAGFQTVVDAAPSDLGRHVGVAAEASRRAGVNVICVTGQYSYYTMPYFNAPYFAITADDLAALFVREVQEGIKGTDVKPGLIKVATPAPELTDYAERALRAAARAHAATGLGIITHTEAGTLGPDQARIFAEEGADLSRVVIGHNDTGDLAYLLEILDTGAVLGYDRMGYEMFLPERIRMACLTALLRLGYERQIVLSHDIVAGTPHLDMSYVVDVVVPGLLEAGISQAAIDTMLFENPKRILAGVGS
jgi:phosphotriesterase-related protein